MELTLAQAQNMMDANGGSLDLGGCTGMTALPEGLTVGGWLYLGGCTGLTALPEGLTVGDWLYLGGCTGLTALPEGLTVGGSLDLGGCTGLTQESYTRLREGDYVAGRYLYADGILTHVKAKRRVGDYDFYVGKIPGRNVVSDGVHYAHCATLREGVADLRFKAAEDRGADQYRGIGLDRPVPLAEAMTMYRIITGACQQGTQQFVAGLGKAVKEAYTVREIMALTAGQCGAERFAAFFAEEG